MTLLRSQFYLTLRTECYPSVSDGVLFRNMTNYAGLRMKQVGILERQVTLKKVPQS